MNTQQQIRDVLGPADPARNALVAPSPLSAHDVILRAEEAGPEVPARRPASRRAVLIGAAATVTLVGSAGLVQVLRDRPVPALPAAPQPVDGVVLQPVSYEINAAEPAGPHLRALAARLVDAPYDQAGGRFIYHHTKSWGGVSAFSPERHMKSYVEERRNWAARDGRRWGKHDVLGVEYPDAASREYWSTRNPTRTATPHPSATSAPSGELREHPPQKLGKLPGDRAALTRMLRNEQSAGHVAMAVQGVFVTHVVPRQARATILAILADKPGFVWRGQVVDRAGRSGLAVTADLTPPAGEYPQRAQMLLVFDPSTGELLAYEYLELAPRRRVLHYLLFLRTGRTDTLG
ncbi:CU044_5270 family protein [Micromonospora sp. DSM 115977]|uniref:CU044_5270 family protein n=1 Tax=Micromonospora reichwaldensis TaxID=3075516 RepID=A0ABU2X198_9ACTN|nr:CU044_5270 family protein [Micromonospora sp. DSM 115977]MDT0531944.1 CU044_5270 family protein [Micromonospora sp. DSM 115977]